MLFDVLLLVFYTIYYGFEIHSMLRPDASEYPRNAIRNLLFNKS